MNTNSQNTFNYYKSLSKYQLIETLKSHYKKLNDDFKTAIGWEGAFWAAMRTACLMLTADGKFNEVEYNLFKQMTDSNPTYDELFNTANAVSGDMLGAVKMARTSNDTRLDSINILLAFCAYKGGMHPGEMALLNDLEK